MCNLPQSPSLCQHVFLSTLLSCILLFYLRLIIICPEALWTERITTALEVLLYYLHHSLEEETDFDDVILSKYCYSFNRGTARAHRSPT